MTNNYYDSHWGAIVTINQVDTLKYVISITNSVADSILLVKAMKQPQIQYSVDIQPQFLCIQQENSADIEIIYKPEVELNSIDLAYHVILKVGAIKKVAFTQQSPESQLDALRGELFDLILTPVRAGKQTQLLMRRQEQAINAQPVLTILNLVYEHLQQRVHDLARRGASDEAQIQATRQCVGVKMGLAYYNYLGLDERLSLLLNSFTSTETDFCPWCFKKARNKLCACCGCSIGCSSYCCNSYMQFHGMECAVYEQFYSFPDRSSQQMEEVLRANPDSQPPRSGQPYVDSQKENWFVECEELLKRTQNYLSAMSEKSSETQQTLSNDYQTRIHQDVEAVLQIITTTEIEVETRLKTTIDEDIQRLVDKVTKSDTKERMNNVIQSLYQKYSSKLETLRDQAQRASEYQQLYYEELKKTQESIDREQKVFVASIHFPPDPKIDLKTEYGRQIQVIGLKMEKAILERRYEELFEQMRQLIASVDQIEKQMLEHSAKANEVDEKRKATQESMNVEIQQFKTNTEALEKQLIINGELTERLETIEGLIADQVTYRQMKSIGNIDLSKLGVEEHFLLRQQRPRSPTDSTDQVPQILKMSERRDRNDALRRQSGAVPAQLREFGAVSAAHKKLDRIEQEVRDLQNNQTADGYNALLVLAAQLHSSVKVLLMRSLQMQLLNYQQYKEIQFEDMRHLEVTLHPDTNLAFPIELRMYLRSWFGAAYRCENVEGTVEHAIYYCIQKNPALLAETEVWNGPVVTLGGEGGAEELYAAIRGLSGVDY